MPSRSPSEIRQSMEANRVELSLSLDRLRGEVIAITDWRRQLEIHRKEAMIAAAVAGFIIGGGVAAIVGGKRRRRRRR